jgi:molybdenum cofactor cytidylyltransferase
MRLVDAIRFKPPIQAAIVGSGGKTTALFRLARQLSGPVIVTTTTHLGLEQISLAEDHFFIYSDAGFQEFLQNYSESLTLVTGPATLDGRVTGLPVTFLERLHTFCLENQISLLIEADGSRGLPLKAPAPHEPVIPTWVEGVIVVAGMQGLNQPLGPEFVHRSERFSELAEIPLGAELKPQAITRVLGHPIGGLKNIPPGARRVVLLNQADSESLQAQAGRIARNLLSEYQTALVGSLKNEAPDEISACYQPVAGIILAAGGATRYGQPKPLLEWRGQPFIRQIAQTALAAGLAPVVVISGSSGEAVAQAVADLPVSVVFNPEWQSGQSSSVRAGISFLPESIGAAVFLLADQPQLTESLLSAELELYRRCLAPIIAPLIDGKRANPVLFDQQVFEALKSIQGDTGGRQVFSQFKVSWLEWNDRRLLLDVDTPEDYQKLLEMQ